MRRTERRWAKTKRQQLGLGTGHRSRERIIAIMLNNMREKGRVPEVKS